MKKWKHPWIPCKFLLQLQPALRGATTRWSLTSSSKFSFCPRLPRASARESKLFRAFLPSPSHVHVLMHKDVSSHSSYEVWNRKRKKNEHLSSIHFMPDSFLRSLPSQRAGCLGVCWGSCTWGIPRRHGGKESTCQWRRCKRLGFNPWVGRVPWRRKWQPGNPCQYYCLENLMGSRALWATAHKESDTTEPPHLLLP